MFIVTGAYTLNLRAVRKSLLYPIKSVFREEGSYLMLIVAFIYSITSNFGKMGVNYSSPTFFAASYFTLLAVLYLIPLSRRSSFRAIFRKELFIIGILSSIMITFHMMAIKLIYVSYMISIKRSSLLFGIIFGALFFNEKGFRERIIGGLLMLAGILIITFSE